MIRDGIHLATTEEERNGVFGLRYDIYVEEMGRYQTVADHENRRLVEPEDETGHIFYAAEDGKVVGTSRFSWGHDAPFSERQVKHYQMAPFLAEVPPEAIMVGERGMVVPRLRGSDLFKEMNEATKRFINEQRIQLVFGACEPHLLSLYLGQGMRTFAEQNINSPEAGYLIPLITVVEDVEYLRRIGAKTLETARDFGADARIPECVDRLVQGTVMSERLTASGVYREEVDEALDALDGGRLGALNELTAEETTRCLDSSNIIECNAGDRVLKKGGVARNMFVLLEGTLEVRDEGRLLNVLSPGDIFGEIAFLLERPRTADIFAATDGVRILSLSESTLRKLIADDPEAAAQILLNLSKILCMRLLRQA